MSDNLEGREHFDAIVKKGSLKRDAVEKVIFTLHGVSKGHRDMAEAAADVYMGVRSLLKNIGDTAKNNEISNEDAIASILSQLEAYRLKS